MTRDPNRPPTHGGNDRRSAIGRTAALSGGVFLAITAAVGLFSYSVRDTKTVVRAAGADVTVPDSTTGPATTDTTASAPVVSNPTVTTQTTSGAPTIAPTSVPLAAQSSTTTSTATTAPAAVTCPPLDGSATPRRSFPAAPPDCIDARATYSAVIATSEGSFTIALDTKRAPKTVNNFVFLARSKFYDGLTFHRVVPGFVIQGGDPLGNGQGGPGYEFADELPDQPGYAVGSVAMANSGANTNGSQFFVVTGELGLAVPGRYSKFAKVTKGLDVLKAIEKLGKEPAADNTEYPPIRTITITSITIKAVGEKASRIPGLAADTTSATDTTAA